MPAEARCAACGCLDGRVLRSLRLSSGETVTTCYNCSQLAGRAIPRPASVAALRALAEVPGERRRGLDRRADDRRTSPPVSFGEWDRRSATRRALDRVATR